MTITPSELAELKRLCEAATPEAINEAAAVDGVVHTNGSLRRHIEYQRTAAFDVALSPERCLRLIAALEEAQTHLAFDGAEILKERQRTNEKIRERDEARDWVRKMASALERTAHAGRPEDLRVMPDLEHVEKEIASWPK